MGDTKALANMVSEIKAAAYQRGFDDGLRAALKAVKGLRPEHQKSAGANGSQPQPVLPVQPQATRQLRENSDQMRVLQTIRAKPGLRGIEILKSLEAAGTPVHERTLRTALARLKEHFIEQREERWYEKQEADHSW